ncbi:MAG: ABC transporter substrate-binding protein, partial [Chloroflexi bacterium]|nr:ABC transporter substrate-binding protein [Chloroflexota bacterium]
MQPRRWIRWIAIASIAVLGVTGCGNDDDAGAPVTEPQATAGDEASEQPEPEPAEPAEELAEDPADEPAEEPADEPAEEPADEPAEEPVSEAPSESPGVVTIGVIYSADNPVYTSESVRAIAEAAAAFFNEAGGIDGRPVEVVACNDLADPNQAALCAEEMVDSDVDAVLSASLFEGGNIPVTTGAGIPHFPTVPNNPAAFTGENIYNITSGVPQIVVGGVIAAEGGIDTVDLLTLETPVLPLLENLYSCGVAANGIALGETIVVPP